jgi:hypothetical protein
MHLSSINDKYFCEIFKKKRSEGDKEKVKKGQM